jgi:hypothetical protein
VWQLDKKEILWYILIELINYKISGGKIYMKYLTISFVFILSIFLCFVGEAFSGKENVKMKSLRIKWQRLVYSGDKTCERCGETGQEVSNAVEKLKNSLKPLGIEVILEEKALSIDACAKDISQSNRIWIAERPLEEWLGAKVGKSLCSTCCGELGEKVECRTVEIGVKIYESIPADLVLQAGLLAAVEIIKGKPTSAPYCGPKVKKTSKEKPRCP